MKWLALLLFVPLLAWAEHVDFSHATNREEAVCTILGKTFSCMAIEQEGKQYFVVFDQEKEYQQWEVLPGNKVRLIWMRDDNMI